MALVPQQQDTFAIAPQAMELAQRLASTEFVPKAIRNRPEAVLAAMLAGRELGLGPMMSLSEINVIDGRPSLSAQAVRALIRGHGHLLWLEEEPTITRCVLCARRRGEDVTHRVTWTREDAERARLLGKDNWIKYPRNMLFARATGEMGRLAFSDLMGGMAYVTEELEDGGIEPGINPAANGLPAPPRQPSARRTRRQKSLPPGNGEGDAALSPSPDQEPLPTAEGEESETSAPSPHSDLLPPSSEGEAAGSAAPPPAETPLPEPPAAEPSGEPAPMQGLTLAQQIAMYCREVGIDRRRLVMAVTGKTSAKEVTREEALEIVGAAREIRDGRAKLVEEGGNWFVEVVTDDQRELWDR